MFRCPVAKHLCKLLKVIQAFSVKTSLTVTVGQSDEHCARNAKVVGLISGEHRCCLNAM